MTSNSRTPSQYYNEQVIVIKIYSMFKSIFVQIIIVSSESSVKRSICRRGGGLLFVDLHEQKIVPHNVKTYI